MSVVNTQKNASVLTTDACVLTMLLQTHRRMCADYVTTDAWVWTSDPHGKTHVRWLHTDQYNRHV